MKQNQRSTREKLMTFPESSHCKKKIYIINKELIGDIIMFLISFKHSTAQNKQKTVPTRIVSKIEVCYKGVLRSKDITVNVIYLLC